MLQLCVSDFETTRAHVFRIPNRSRAPRALMTRITPVEPPYDPAVAAAARRHDAAGRPADRAVPHRSFATATMADGDGGWGSYELGRRALGLASVSARSSSTASAPAAAASTSGACTSPSSPSASGSPPSRSPRSPTVGRRPVLDRAAGTRPHRRGRRAPRPLRRRRRAVGGGSPRLTTGSSSTWCCSPAGTTPSATPREPRGVDLEPDAPRFADYHASAR